MDTGRSPSAAEEAIDSVSTKAEEVAAYHSSEAKRARLQSMLAALLDDPILADVPRKPSLADVDTLINLELGSAMRITVVKLDSTSFDVAVLNTATVKDLKMAIRKKINEIEQEQMGHRHISWKHIWDNYCLTHQSEKLMDDNFVLSSHGIRNNSKVSFLPHIMSRVYRKHSRRRKHRFFHGLSRKM
ncbi:U11/U12 small nuclear ribonucleoprotein 25 kDa protein [Oryza brachyantha]|nr:U11/U12 small nuclear ribonucleoprotein 25 kDa protein [Oryza brachyantha]